MRHHARFRIRRRRLSGVFVAAALICGGAGVHGAAASTPTTSDASAAPTALPFDLPSTGALRSSGKKVFAHYIASLPKSLDNQQPAGDYYARNYLAPRGEGGVHAAYGGFLRNRPQGRAPLAAAWRLQDMQTEVREARAAGIDGFTFDVLQVQNGSVPQLWENANLMMQASAAVDPGFKIMLMPDMAGGLGAAPVATLAQGLATLARYPSAYRLADGRVVISPFLAEAHPAEWWSNLMAIMKNTYHTPVALLPVFVANESNYTSSFAPISYGMSSWGSRNPQFNDPSKTWAGSARARAAAVKSRGLTWMQPVSVQDERPNQGVFDEAQNTVNLRNTWELARLTNADLVQIPTWNDFTEGTAMEPSADNGSSLLDLNSYYLSWYKTGVAPTVTRDTVYLSHRKHFVADQPSFPQTRLMKLRGGSPARDTVEALTFMTSPGTVTVTVGSQSYLCAVNAGVDTCTVPLAKGTISAVTARSGVATAAVTSPHTVTRSPIVQDLSYVMASSGRTPGALGSPLPPATAVPRSVAVTASADTYANAGAPDSNYGTSASLSVRGSAAASSYLGFTIPAAPSGSRLTGAALQLRTVDAVGNGPAGPVSMSLVAAPWSEAGLTWRNRPVAGATVASLPAVLAPATTYNTDVPTHVVTSLGSGSTLVLSGTGTRDTRFWSSDFSQADYRPQIVLTYTPVPASVSALDVTTLVRASSSTYVNEGAPSTTFGTSASLSSRGSLGALSYLRFSVPAPPIGKVLVGAKLRLHTTTERSAGSVDTQTITGIEGFWSPTAQTWRNRPALSGVAVGTLTGATTPDMQYESLLDPAWLQARAAADVTMAVSAGGSDSFWFWSANFATPASQPALVLSYA